MAEADQLAGMDEEGLRRTLGELLASNKATQANLEALQQQFPIQASNIADSIPSWEELEEGGLEPPNPEEGEPESFQEQLGIASFSDLIWVEVAANGAILRGGAGLTVERVSTGIYKVWLQTKTQKEFDYPGSIRSAVSYTVGEQATNINVNLIKSEAGVLGYQFRIVENLAGSTVVDAAFHFFAATLAAENE